MGQVITSFRNCLAPHNNFTTDNTFLQVLVVGDPGVGKSTLVDSFVDTSDFDESDESQKIKIKESKDKNEDRIRIVNCSRVIRGLNPKNFNETKNVSITIVDVNGQVDQISRQIRDSYYVTSNIIFIVYNVGNVRSLKNAKAIWAEEINLATEKNGKNNTQLVLVGVNPEVRNKYQESDVSVLDDVNTDLSLRLRLDGFLARS